LLGEHDPAHARKAKFGPAVAVSSTSVPSSKVAEQVFAQLLIPAGFEVTVPVPVTVTVSVRRTGPAGAASVVSSLLHPANKDAAKAKPSRRTNLVVVMLNPL
jgi:hypothetical protein